VQPPLNPRYGRFEGEAVTRWIRDPQRDDRLMELLADLTFVRANGDRWTARRGLIFDGASIPRFLWSLTGSPFDGDYREAAIIHDQYCKDGRAGVSPYDSGTVHRVFYEAQRALGVSAWRARVKWAAVRLGGPHFKAAPAASTERAA
jgi:hypothetical protein